MKPVRTVLAGALASALAAAIGIAVLTSLAPRHPITTPQSAPVENAPPPAVTGNLLSAPDTRSTPIPTAPQVHASPSTETVPDATPPPTPPDPHLEPHFAAFLSWARAGAAAPPATEFDHGLELARRRREDLAKLIRTHPRRALELALPADLRATLAPRIVDLLETPIDARGDLEVLCALPDPQRAGKGHLVPLQRFAVFAEARYEAFVHGRRLGEPTLRDIPLRGIALDDAMAVEEPPETAPIAAAGGLLPASQGTAQGAPSGMTSTSTGRADGLKRLIFIRVDFSDLVGESFSTNRAAQLARELHAFYQDNSFGRAGFFEIGAGSAVTPVLRLARTAASYGSANASGALRTDARAAARAAGYNLGEYDYDLVCFGSVPGFGWSGLGFVGAAGAWIRGTSSTGVVAHELGHNYGLNHANFWDTGGESTLGAGTSIEYGDKFDTMGAANAGNYHFNARYKRLLGWLRPGEYTVATTNGTYRIHAHDRTNNPALPRALQVFANARTNYWLEFRQRFTSNPWLLAGTGLRWAGRGSEASLLIDTTPGSPREKDDSPITLGRTFSDPALRIHLTPVARGGDNPAWIDVVVQRGDFPGNRAPSLQLGASATSGSTATLFEFRAQATDPDGNPLAYHWDFGDDTLGTNAPIVSHRWSAAGDYTVACTVSDLRGGLARRLLPVRVGAPTTFRVSGRVFQDGEPAPGVRVSAGSGRQTTTDSDGDYTLGGLARGTVTLTASLDGNRFTPVTFSNPVQLTASREGLDFAAADASGPRPVTLLPAGSTWRYWDAGTLPADNWFATEYADSHWNHGAAILGYGGDRETTVVSFGPSSSRKFITTWFRSTFVVEDPARLASVRLALLRDDGAVVHLNGTELLRDNLPAGTITPDTVATNAVGGAEELTYFEFDVETSKLVAGTNTLAVEIHQSSGSSSDIAFDLRLTAERLPSVETALLLSRPEPGQVFTTPARIPVAAIAGESPSPLRQVIFLADDHPIGTSAAAPHTITWNTSSPGSHVLTARAVYENGTTFDSPQVPIEINDARLTPTLVRRGSNWTYLDTTNAPAGWADPAFDDRTWLTGPARFGYGEDGEFTVVRFGPDAARKRVTTWFRHAFHVAEAASVTNLVCRLQRDDGAVVYLNGQELFRIGLRTGTVTPDLFALADIGTDAEQAWQERPAPATALREGRNVLAVEVHQASASSDDLGFDLELVARRSALPPEDPQLHAALLADGTRVLHWPADATGWRLESTTTLAPNDSTAWQPVGASPETVDERIEIRLQPSSETTFYRLTRTSP